MPRVSPLIATFIVMGCSPAQGPVDSGVIPDAGTPLDAGVDAGTFDAGTWDDLSVILEPIRAQATLPGLAAAVIKGDELIALGATGVRKLGAPQAVTVEDEWHLGSDTKAMTATLIGLEVDRGTMRLEDTVATMFSGETIDPSWQAVTLEQLLRHRGGAPASVPTAIWSQLWQDGTAPDALMKSVRAMLALPVAQAPGNYVYANAGFMIAGAALERRTGQTWEARMQSELFTPLGMSSCGFGAAGTAALVDQPWGHGGMPLAPIAPGPSADNPRGLGPAGTVHCSLRDWGKFISLHLAGERGEDRLVTSATIRRLHTPPAGGNYAAGWGVTGGPWTGGVAFSHAGSNSYNYAVVWIAPAKNLAFLVNTNIALTGTPAAVDSVVNALAARYAP